MGAYGGRLPSGPGRPVESRKQNQTIAADSLLGPQFRVGHSVVTPSGEEEIHDPVSWFKQVVGTEIGPLLEEYWFDQHGKASEEKGKLLQGLSS